MVIDCETDIYSGWGTQGSHPRRRRASKLLKTRRTSQPRKALSYCSPDRRNSKQQLLRASNEGQHGLETELTGQISKGKWIERRSSQNDRVPLNHGRNIRFSRVCLAEIESDI